MCGFAGILERPGKKVDRTILKNMGSIVKHRGPDDCQDIAIDTTGTLNTCNLGMAFSRLAIIDRSNSGRQPMSNDDGTITLVFNGEIYNVPELKSELGDYPFKGYSDTEVLLALYEKIGNAAFEKLNGMFAIALWDERKQKLFLVRDRFGIKPLYYTVVGGKLFFASEVKSLFCSPEVPRNFDPYGVIEYFSFHYCLKERTVFDNINLLQPGEYLIIAPDTPHEIKRVQYWDIHYRPDHSISIDTFASMLREQLISAINRQTRSDVPVGSFLSSGMDTGAITVLAKKLIPQLHTFTCGFDVSSIDTREQFCDEMGDAQKLASLLGTQHHCIKLDHAALPQLIGDVAWHMEDLRVGISYQLYAIAQEVKKYVTVVLSGTGGDELFGGYGWRYAKIMNMKTSDTFDDAYYKIWLRILDDKSRWELFSDDIKKKTNAFNPRDSYKAVMDACKERDSLHRALYFDMKGFLQGLLLVDDRLNMAHSVEARVPLLDNNVVDLAFKIPSSMKFDGKETKIVLKKALKGILPDEVIERRKQGFTPPDAHWMRRENRQYLHDILLSKRFLERGWFNKTAVENVIKQHMTGVKNHRFLLWSLLCFEQIGSLFLDSQNERDAYEPYFDRCSRVQRAGKSKTIL